MKRLLIISIILLSGCCEDKVILKCPPPSKIDGVIYKTETLPDGVKSSEMIKALTQDLISCKNVNSQFTLMYENYKKLSEGNIEKK